MYVGLNTRNENLQLQQRLKLPFLTGKEQRNKPSLQVCRSQLPEKVKEILLLEGF
jgi:hypothetical protein